VGQRGRTRPSPGDIFEQRFDVSRVGRDHRSDVSIERRGWGAMADLGHALVFQ